MTLPSVSSPTSATTSAATPATLAAFWWAGGLNLRERWRLAGGVGLVNSSAPATAQTTAASAGTGAGQRARRRLDRWRAAHDLAHSGQFHRRLDALGATEPQFLALLGTDPATLVGASQPPDWARLVNDVLATAATTAVSQPAAAQPAARPAEFEGVNGENSWSTGLLAIMKPFVDRAMRDLASYVERHGLRGHQDFPAVAHGLAIGLGRHLVALSARVLVLELNVLRVTDRLPGGTGEERFASFVAHYQRPENLAALCAEYPVLARLLGQATAYQTQAAAEMLSRLDADRADLVRLLCAGVDPGPLTEVLGGGDTHQRGRAVAVLRFTSGHRVVYKPRSLAVHTHFNEMLAWTNERIPHLDLRRLAVIERKGYGWLEYADAAPCHSGEQVARFYHRQGVLLALLYLLGGCDFHYENLIACADQPVLVDLEALLHPSIPVAGPPVVATDPARLALDSSVARSTLLPVLLVGANGAVDLSGLGGDKDVPMPVTSLGWHAAGTDEMRLTREHQLFTGGHNRPSISGHDADPADYYDDLLAGFHEGYDTLWRHRSELASPDSPLWKFTSDDVRVVVRATRIYAKLMDESTHPDVMRDALDRDRVFDNLWAASLDDPVRQRLVEDEIDEMWNGDVPLFLTQPASRDLTNGTGIVVPEIIDQSSLDRSLHTADLLSPADRERQTWIIEAALASRPIAPMAPDETTPPLAQASRPSSRTSGAPSMPDPASLIRHARRIGDRIVDAAYRGPNQINWLGLDLVDTRHWITQPLGPGLYRGYGGVALFLAQLADLTGVEKYASACVQALAAHKSLVDHMIRSVHGSSTRTVDWPGLAGLNGASAIAYVSTMVAAMLGDAHLADHAERALTLAETALATETDPSVVSGIAGCLASSLAIAETTGSPAALRTANAAAAALRDRVDRDSDAFLGFGHGLAGVGWALLRHWWLTGDDDSQRAGLASFARQHALATGDAGVRSTQSPAEPASTGPNRGWYGGMTGAVLARATAIDWTDDASLREGLTWALTQPREHLGHSLGLGDFGLLEALSRCGPAYADERADHLDRLIRTIESGATRCDTPRDVSTMDVMSGWAGIGHGLLRLVAPDRIASVLLLEPLANDIAQVAS